MIGGSDGMTSDDSPLDAVHGLWTSWRDAGTVLREEVSMNRRAWLKQAGFAAAGLSIRPLRASAQAQRTGPHVQRYATLGRTGMKVSDISFGSSRLGGNDDDTVRYA